MRTLPEALAPLAAYRQFVVCKFMPDPDRPGKTIKHPLNIHTGRQHDAHDPSIWLDATTACATATAWGAPTEPGGFGYGVGFTFTEQDPFFFIDVDACLVFDAEGKPAGWTPIVAELAAALPGAAIEISQSGRGLHIIGTGSAPADRRKKDKTNVLFDLYTEKRFVALTGTSITGHAGTEHTVALHAITERHLKNEPGAASQDWTTEPCAGWNGPEDDLVLIERAMRSQSASAAFGKKASFADLWTCNVDVLAVAYPPDGNGTTPYDASAADSALAQHLAFWTGKNCERIKRLMQLSAMVRPKWEREEGYLDPTIIKVVARQAQYLTDKTPEPLSLSANDPDSFSKAPEAAVVGGQVYLGPDEQIKLFNGCVYVTDVHRVLIPGGMLLKPEQFRVLYGGYSFVMGPANDKTSTDAWEVFTQAPSYRSPRADGTCFKPALPAAQLIRDAGRTRANVWWPINVARQVGDVTPFMRHLEKVLPDSRDRQILLSYMAACVQHKGTKFQWAPLLQGVEGNGKTLFTRCVAEAIGQRYSHLPPAHEISEKFNSWLFNTLFIGVEDIYVPDQKQEIIEILKPMITSDYLAKRAMNTDQNMQDVVCNFMFNSNHKSAVRKTRNDRRFCVFYSAQQEEEDIRRAGMGGDYFPNLYAWLRNGGYAIVSELLHTYPIESAFNPATECQRAPATSSTEAAIESSRGGVEQEIQEAIEQEIPGFCGGWISSIALDRLLERIGAARRIPLNKRREMLAEMGYEQHPGLPGGRLPNIVMPDGGKPILFVIKSLAARLLTDIGEISRAYTGVQSSSALTQR